MTMFSDAAAFYVGLGWMVFPLAEGSKIPAVKGGKGFKDASDDFATIAAWAREFPKANIGIATGAGAGIIVIDVDPRNGGSASIAALAGKGFLFPGCPEARTGNGGRHLFFAYRPGIKASKDRLGKGIDVKSTGGYVVGAPSVIAPSQQGPGGQYRWVRKPTGVILPELPSWGIARLTPPKPRNLPKFEPAATAEGAERSLEGMARRLAGASVGHRNNLLNWAAFRAGDLVRQGKLGPGAVSTRLTQAALAAGLALPEVQATIASGLRGALENGGGR